MYWIFGINIIMIIYWDRSECSEGKNKTTIELSPVWLCVVSRRTYVKIEGVLQLHVSISLSHALEIGRQHRKIAPERWELSNSGWTMWNCECLSPMNNPHWLLSCYCVGQTYLSLFRDIFTWQHNRLCGTIVNVVFYNLR